MNNVFFDTCVYHQPGIDLLADVIENKNILFGSEMVGAVRGIDPDDRALFRRHQALRRRARHLRPGEAHDLRGQCAQGLPAARRDPEGARAMRSSDHERHRDRVCRIARSPSATSSSSSATGATRWRPATTRATGWAPFPFSEHTNAVMTAHHDGIAITLTTADTGENERMRGVIERHIDRFAFREAPLTYEWKESRNPGNDREEDSGSTSTNTSRSSTIFPAPGCSPRSARARATGSTSSR